MSRNHVRTTPPRQLTANETFETLSHWKTTFKTFYKRDDTYKIFFKKKMEWDQSMEDYDLKEEVGGEMRKAPELSKTCKISSAHCQATYLTHTLQTTFLRTPGILRMFGEWFMITIMLKLPVKVSLTLNHSTKNQKRPNVSFMRDCSSIPKTALGT